MDIKLHFEPPGAAEPGYLRRQIKAREFIQALDKSLDPESVYQIVDFLVPYIHGKNGAVIDGEDAKEYLLDATSDQFYSMLVALLGVAEKKAD